MSSSRGWPVLLTHYAHARAAHGSGVERGRTRTHAPSVHLTVRRDNGGERATARHVARLVPVVADDDDARRVAALLACTARQRRSAAHRHPVHKAVGEACDVWKLGGHERNWVRTWQFHAELPAVAPSPRHELNANATRASRAPL